MVEAIQSRRADGVRVGVVAVEGVIFLVNFLKLMLGDKPSKSINRSFSVGEVGGRAIYGVFEVEVTHEDGIDCMVVVSERVKFSKPEHAVRAMKVDVDKTESFTC